MSKEAFKPQDDLKGFLSAQFREQAADDKGWAADHGLNHREQTEEHAFHYGMKDGAASIGQISRTNENEEVSHKGETKKKEEKKRFENMLRKAANDFYSGMKNWTLGDYSANGTAYRAWLNEEAQKAYDEGDIEKGDKLSETAHEFYEKEQDIMNNHDLSETEKKEALEALWKDQDQELIQQFVREYDNKSSDVVLNKNKEFVEKIEDNQSTAPDISSTNMPELNF